MCLKSMIEKNDIGNICHEHIEFYSLKSLKFLFENNGLEIFRIEEMKLMEEVIEFTVENIQKEVLS